MPGSEGDVSTAEWASDLCERLEIPGLFDVHVHFMPENVLSKVWAYFDDAGPLIGREWPIAYKLSLDQRLGALQSLGVLRFSALSYPHRAGMARWLNEWSANFSGQHHSVVKSATFYPELDAPEYVQAALTDGTEIFKAHVQVGDYDPGDPLLDGVWSLLDEARVPTVIHCGSGPVPGRHTGVGPIINLLQRHPSLPLIIAHMGDAEYEPFLSLAERYDHVYLDTTMTFTPFTEARSPYPRRLLGRLSELREKVLLGSDFPNIPYDYREQIDALVRLGLGDDWLRSVLWGNGHRIFDRVS
jgi:hypothetical protein